MRDRNVPQLEVVEFDVGEGVDGYFFADPDLRVAAVAVNPDLPAPAKQACEIHARGLNGRRPPRGGRRFMLEAREVEDLDPNAVLAIRCVIEDLRPGWVAEVKEACRFANHPRVIADWCDMSIAVVVAIIDILKARGEIPRSVGEVA